MNLRRLKIDIRLCTSFHVRDVQIAPLKHICQANWCYTVIQILANKIVITTFSLVPVEYGINHTATIGIFVRVVK